MDESNSPPVGPGSRGFIYQPIAIAAAALEGGVEIRNLVADVMYPWPAPCKEPGDGAVGGGWFEQFDLRAAKGERHNDSAVRRLGRLWLETQDVPIEGKGICHARNGDANVGDVWLIGHRRLRESGAAGKPWNLKPSRTMRGERKEAVKQCLA